MPLVSQTFDQLLDFTRTTAGSFVGSNGLIQNTPASVNLLTWTQQFDNAAWTKTAATVTANTTVAPDGTSTADTLIEDATTNVHGTQQSLTLTATTHTLSVYLKAQARTWAQVTNGSVANGFAYFNLATGAVGTVGAGVTATSITDAGNGWYRCSITFTAIAGGNILAVRTASANNTANYLGDGTSGIFAWGAQLEASATATTYTRNNGGVFPPRFDYDPVTLAPKGILIEEQRVNLVTYSDDLTNVLWVKGDTTVTANATTSPDGTTNADKLVETATNTFHFALQNLPSAVTTIAYTASVYVKAAERTWCILALGGTAFSSAAWFNLSTGTVGTQTGSPSSVTITDAGNGWWRLTITKTPASVGTANVAINMSTGDGVASYAGDGTSGLFIYGAQLEAGAFPTSYIPTVASQVTRAPDITSIVAPNFAPWYNQSEGTFVAELITSPRSGSGTQEGIINLTATSRVLRGAGSVAIGWFLGSGTFMASGVTAASTVVKTAGGYSAGNNAASTNGAAVTTDTGSTYGSPTEINIGHILGGSFLNGHIRSIRYYPVRLSNAQLQALTA